MPELTPTGTPLTTQHPRTQPLDLSRYLGKVRNRVQRVGVELEGAWVKTPVTAECTFGGDGSVSVHHPDAPTVGECQSVPLPPIKLKQWLAKHYPVRVNQSCGMHIHMSFADSHHYSALMAPEFEATVIHELKRWGTEEAVPASHPFWNRVNGKNEYCTIGEFYADAQAARVRKDYTRTPGHHRYTAIAYPQKLHGTIECRVLPMFEDAGQSLRAVFKLLDVTNAFLASTKKPVKKRITVEE